MQAIEFHILREFINSLVQGDLVILSQQRMRSVSYKNILKYLDITLKYLRLSHRNRLLFFTKLGLESLISINNKG